MSFSKKDWVATDGISATELNRMENNMLNMTIPVTWERHTSYTDVYSAGWWRSNETSLTAMGYCRFPLINDFNYLYIYCQFHAYTTDADFAILYGGSSWENWVRDDETEGYIFKVDLSSVNNGINYYTYITVQGRQHHSSGGYAGFLPIFSFLSPDPDVFTSKAGVTTLTWP